jgi:hypothetical protein
MDVWTALRGVNASLRVLVDAEMHRVLHTDVLLKLRTQLEARWNVIHVGADSAFGRFLDEVMPNATVGEFFTAVTTILAQRRDAFRRVARALEETPPEGIYVAYTELMEALARRLVAAMDETAYAIVSSVLYEHGLEYEIGVGNMWWYATAGLERVLLMHRDAPVVVARSDALTEARLAFVDAIPPNVALHMDLLQLALRVVAVEADGDQLETWATAGGLRAYVPVHHDIDRAYLGGDALAERRRDVVRRYLALQIARDPFGWHTGPGALARVSLADGAVMLSGRSHEDALLEPLGTFVLDDDDEVGYWLDNDAPDDDVRRAISDAGLDEAVVCQTELADWPAELPRYRLLDARGAPTDDWTLAEDLELPPAFTALRYDLNTDA